MTRWWHEHWFTVAAWTLCVTVTSAWVWAMVTADRNDRLDARCISMGGTPFHTACYIDGRQVALP